MAAGLGLATMSFAFKPLPKPGVPVVISTAATTPAPQPTEASFRHMDAETRVAPDLSAVEPAPTHPRGRIHHELAIKALPEPAPAAAPAPAPEAPAKPAPVQAPVAAAPPPKPATLQVAKADAPGEKLCKAPQPQVLSAKTLQAALSLRYDPKLKTRPIDVPAPDQPSDDAQRRLKLSALLANMMSN